MEKVQPTMDLAQEQVRPVEETGEAPPPIGGAPSIIQWETASFYTYETEVKGEPPGPDVPKEDYPPYTEMSVGMSRLGSADGTASVSYTAFDMSARAGVNFMPIPPTTVTFEHGEAHKEVIVRVMPNKIFAGTVEFGLFIDKATAKGAGVGKYLHTATIKIIDQSHFPHNSLGDYVKGGNRDRVKEIHPAVLVLNFLRMCWTIPVVRKGSIKVMLTHQYHNAIMISNILVLFFVVKTLSWDHPPLSTQEIDQRKAKLYIYALLWLMPFLGKHYLDYRKCYWKVGGGLRKHLQTLLLKKFLNYNGQSRSVVAIEKVVMAMVRDVVDAVSEAYIVAIDLAFGSIVKVFLLIGAMLYLQASSGSLKVGLILPPILAILALPIFIVVFLKVRASKGFELRQSQFDAENGLVDHVIKSVLNYQLVADYDRRTFQVERYQIFIDAFNKAATAYASFTVNSKYFVPWLTAALVTVWIIYGGIRVLDDKIQLATFLSTITIFRTAGAEFEKAYQLQLRMTGAYASIAQITTYLNLPIDVPMRRVFGRKRRKFGLQLRQEERAKLARGEVDSHPDEVAVDRLPIRLEHVDFSYKGESILNDLNLEFAQGKMVAMKGPPGQGKATVLRLLANHVFPVNIGKALVFTPPHLRCVQVQEDPLILGPSESIWDNLIYGIKKSPSTNWEHLEQRSREILIKLGASEDMMANFKTPYYLGTGGIKLTRPQRQLINLGRAFVMNPEMIVVHKPTAVLPAGPRENALKMMEEYVRNRGVNMDPLEPLVMRRKRTLIFTTLSDEVASRADEIYLVSEGSIEKMEPGA